MCKDDLDEDIDDAGLKPVFDSFTSILYLFLLFSAGTKFQAWLTDNFDTSSCGSGAWAMSLLCSEAAGYILYILNLKRKKNELEEKPISFDFFQSLRQTWCYLSIQSNTDKRNYSTVYVYVCVCYVPGQRFPPSVPVDFRAC